MISADEETRSASITGAFVCLVDALRRIWKETDELPLLAQVAAVSAGKRNGKIILDLCYEEDSSADVDCNVVKTSSGKFVEFQGTGEGGFFSTEELSEIVSLADEGLARLYRVQRDVLELTRSEKALFDALDMHKKNEIKAYLAGIIFAVLIEFSFLGVKISISHATSNYIMAYRRFSTSIVIVTSKYAFTFI